MQLCATALAVSLAIPAGAFSNRSAATDSAVQPSAADEAVELTNQKRYAEAADAFARAHEETGEAAYLYAQAMSLRRAGSCRSAIGAFETFIAAGPPPADIEAAQTQIGECESLLEKSGANEAPKEEPPPPVEPSPPPVEPAVVAAPADQPRWYRDPLGGVLVGVGAAAAVTGGALLGVSYASADVPPDESERGYDDRSTSVRRLSIAGISMLAAGGALLIGGTIRYALVARGHKRAAASERRARVAAGGLMWRF